MSRRTRARSSSNKNSARARASSVLPTPVGPRNRNEPRGRFGSDNPARRAAHGISHGDQSVFLADDAPAQIVFHLQQFLHLAFDQSGDRHARPFGDDFGDVLGIDFLFEHLPGALPLLQMAQMLFQIALQLRQSPIAQLRRLAQIGGLRGALDLELHGFQLFFQIRNPPNRVFFALPLRF